MCVCVCVCACVCEREKERDREREVYGGNSIGMLIEDQMWQYFK